MTIGAMKTLLTATPGDWCIACGASVKYAGLVSVDNNQRMFAYFSPMGLKLADARNIPLIYTLVNCFAVPDLQTIGLFGLQQPLGYQLCVNEDGGFLSGENFAVSLAGNVFQNTVTKFYVFDDWSLKQRVGSELQEIFRVKAGRFSFPSQDKPV